MRQKVACLGPISSKIKLVDEKEKEGARRIKEGREEKKAMVALLVFV